MRQNRRNLVHVGTLKLYYAHRLNTDRYRKLSLKFDTFDPLAISCFLMTKSTRRRCLLTRVLSLKCITAGVEREKKSQTSESINP